MLTAISSSLFAKDRLYSAKVNVSTEGAAGTGELLGIFGSLTSLGNILKGIAKDSIAAFVLFNAFEGFI